MFVKRLISGIVLVVAGLVVYLTGGLLSLIVTGIISIIGMYELFKVFGIEKSNIASVGYLMAAVYYADLYFNFLPDMLLPSVLFMIVLLGAFVLAYPKYDIYHVAEAFFAFYYVAVMLSYLYRTRSLPLGIYLVWLIFLCSWGADTAAYCVGKLIGKHKMTPKLSPKKSIEGAIGGILGSALFVFLFVSIFGDKMSLDLTQKLALPIGAGVGAAISMIGDLAASAIKRHYDIKDYGNIIPGHGGILDRFDSVIITAPIIFYLCRIFM